MLTATSQFNLHGFNASHASVFTPHTSNDRPGHPRAPASNFRPYISASLRVRLPLRYFGLRLLCSRVTHAHLRVRTARRTSEAQKLRASASGIDNEKQAVHVHVPRELGTLLKLEAPVVDLDMLVDAEPSADAQTVSSPRDDALTLSQLSPRKPTTPPPFARPTPASNANAAASDAQSSPKVVRPTPSLAPSKPKSQPAHAKPQSKPKPRAEAKAKPESKRAPAEPVAKLAPAENPAPAPEAKSVHARIPSASALPRSTKTKSATPAEKPAQSAESTRARSRLRIRRKCIPPKPVKTTIQIQCPADELDLGAEDNGMPVDVLANSDANPVPSDDLEMRVDTSPRASASRRFLYPLTRLATLPMPREEMQMRAAKRSRSAMSVASAVSAIYRRRRRRCRLPRDRQHLRPRPRTLEESFLLPFSPPTSPSADEDPVVLRIDNVPWDITPPAILTFLGVSPASGARAHVLLDRLGKTLSHAFVELPSEAAARAVLRGEHRAAPILGTGRRARAVTLTRSSQPALMAALFPSWAGAFDGPAPSLAGVTGPSLPGALEGGLMRESELTELLWLMRTPDTRFVKVPALPFYALASILTKFPTDRDSRVLRALGPEDADPEPLKDVVRTALGCHAFTEQQLRGLSEFDTPSESPARSDADTDEAEFHARYDQQQQQQCKTYAPPVSPCRPYEPLAPAPALPSPPPTNPTPLPTSAPTDDVKDAGACMSDLAPDRDDDRAKPYTIPDLKSLHASLAAERAKFDLHVKEKERGERGRAGGREAEAGGRGGDGGEGDEAGGGEPFFTTY
ncbi:hypothetical protein FB451DRAFT_1376876 [Mycena latifolia]|nr:hypothetical protein FB451DRAFT_1376876 [Mycena latifolia]